MDSGIEHVEAFHTRPNSADLLLDASLSGDPSHHAKLGFKIGFN
jgi:hypothetical protein